MNTQEAWVLSILIIGLTIFLTTVAVSIIELKKKI
jgi:hypothetical protein